MLHAEGRKLGSIPCDQRRRHELLVVQDEKFFRRIAHLRGIIHHQRLGMDMVQHVGGGDVAHVEGRILAHEHHVEVAEADALLLAKREIFRELVAHLDRMARGRENAACQRQGFRLVIEQRMAAELRLQHHRKGGIALDVDVLDGVHLDGDIERHDSGVSRKGILDMVRQKVGAHHHDVKTAEILVGYLVARHPEARRRRRCAWTGLW